jgi:tetratricopeptide (TPR) repeat protein
LLRELTPEKQAKLVTSKPANMEAYEYYLRGYKAYFKKFRTTWTIPDFEETERYFLKAISLEPTYADAYVYLADLYDSRAAMISTDRTKFRHLGDSAMRIGFKLNPNSILTLLGHAGSFQNNIDSTFFYLKRAYRVSPDAPETIEEIAGFYLGIGLNEPALKFVHRLVELDPLSESGIIAIGGIQLRHGAYEDATKTLMKVIELNHDNANAHFLLGQIFIMQGNRKNALNHLEIVKQINPEGRQATVLQAMLFAQEGRKSEALRLVKNDLRILSLLGMKKEFLTRADSLSKTTGNEIHISAVLDPTGLLKNPVYNFVRNEGEFKIIFDRVKKGYEERVAKYGELE